MTFSTISHELMKLPSFHYLNGVLMKLMSYTWINMHNMLIAACFSKFCLRVFCFIILSKSYYFGLRSSLRKWFVVKVLVYWKLWYSTFSRSTYREGTFKKYVCTKLRIFGPTPTCSVLLDVTNTLHSVIDTYHLFFLYPIP